MTSFVRLSKEQDARRRVGILELDSNTNYINGEGDKGYDDHIYNVDVATDFAELGSYHEYSSIRN